MQLTVEVLTRADGRHALFLGDQCLCHVAAGALALNGNGTGAAQVPEAERAIRRQLDRIPPTVRRGVKKAARRIQRVRRDTAAPKAPPATATGGRLTAADREAKQAQAAILAKQGKTLPEIAEAVDAKYATVWGWQKAGLLGDVASGTSGERRRAAAPATSAVRRATREGTTAELAGSWME